MKNLLFIGLTLASVKLFYTRNQRNETQIILSIPSNLISDKKVTVSLYKDNKMPIKNLNRVEKVEDTKFDEFARDLKNSIKKEFYSKKVLFVLILNTSRIDQYFFRISDDNNLLFQTSKIKFEKTETGLLIEFITGPEKINDELETYIGNEESAENNSEIDGNEDFIEDNDENSMTNESSSEREDTNLVDSSVEDNEIIEPELTNTNINKLDQRDIEKVSSENPEADDVVISSVEDNEIIEPELTKTNINKLDQRDIEKVSSENPEADKLVFQSPEESKIKNTSQPLEQHTFNNHRMRNSYPATLNSQIGNPEISTEKCDYSVMNGVIKFCAAFTITTAIGVLFMKVMGF